MDSLSSNPYHPSSQFVSYGPITASGNTSIHQGNTYVGQDSLHVEFEAFCRSLSFPDLSLREESMKAAFEGTFEWIFQRQPHQSEQCGVKTGQQDPKFAASNLFTSWISQDTPKRRFWIRGKAGSGKSTFVSFVSTHESLSTLLQSSRPDREAIVLRHYFWQLGSPMQRNLPGCLRSIIWQFFATQPGLGFTIWYEHLRSLRIVMWSPHNLKMVFRCILEKSSCFFCLFIDGVDECVDSEDLLDMLRGLEHMENLKVCLSGRPERRYQLAFSNWLTIHLDQLTYSDMRVFATQKLQDLFQKSCLATASEFPLSELIRILLRKAEGVFVWLCVAVQSLRQGFENLDDRSSLLERINEFPEDIHQLYLFLLKRHKTDLDKYAANAALTFKLLLRSMKHPPHRSLRRYLVYGSDKGSDNLSLTRLAWARSHALRKKFFASDLKIPTIEAIWKELKLDAAAIQLPVHCGNFTEVIDRPLHIIQRKAKFKFKAKCPILTTMIFTSNYVQFIHKTVGDFLEDKDTGRALLAADPLSDEQLEKSLQDADLVMAISYMILTEEANDKASRVILSRLEDPSRCYAEWQLLETVIMKSFADTSEHWCCQCFLEEMPDTVVVPNREHGFLYYCVAVGRLDYLRMAIRDPDRDIPVRILTDISSILVTMIASQHLGDRQPDPNNESVQAVIGDLLAHGVDIDVQAFSSYGIPTSKASYASSDILRCLIDHLRDKNSAAIRSVAPQPLRTGNDGAAGSTTLRLESYKLALLYWNPGRSINNVDCRFPRRVLDCPHIVEGKWSLDDKIVRLMLWHQDSGRWHIVSPEMSRLLLESHTSLHNEIFMSMGLPRLCESLKSAVPSTTRIETGPGLIWLRLAEDLGRFALGMRCVLRKVIGMNSLQDVIQHLRWSEDNTTRFFSNKFNLHPWSDRAQFMAKIAKDLSSALQGRMGQGLHWERAMYGYLVDCGEYLHALDLNPKQAYGFSRRYIVPDWYARQRIDSSNLMDQEPSFIERESIPPIQSVAEIAAGRKTNNDERTCTNCSVLSIPCFTFVDTALCGRCTTCFFAGKSCSNKGDPEGPGLRTRGLKRLRIPSPDQEKYRTPTDRYTSNESDVNNTAAAHVGAWANMPSSLPIKDPTEPPEAYTSFLRALTPVLTSQPMINSSVQPRINDTSISSIHESPFIARSMPRNTSAPRPVSVRNVVTRTVTYKRAGDETPLQLPPKKRKNIDKESHEKNEERGLS